MSDRESFLTRWSRRKRAETSPRSRGEVGERSEPGEGDSQRAPVESPPHPDPLPASGEREPARASGAIDPASLPSLESIHAGTDIRAFLAPGVPTELTRAALRRAWATDPAIRDFVGLAENAWDFTAPEGVPGFASLSADEVQRLAAQFFAPPSPEKGAAIPAESPSPETAAAGEPEPAPTPQVSHSPDTPIEAVPVEEDAAVQEKSSPPPPRRRHGGALAE